MAAAPPGYQPSIDKPPLFTWRYAHDAESFEEHAIVNGRRSSLNDARFANAGNTLDFATPSCFFLLPALAVVVLECSRFFTLFVFHRGKKGAMVDRR